mgnify:CR=1 FL=1
MAIKPILFNTEMVRVILDGRKSCTRRIVKGFIPNDAKWGYTVFTPKGCISCRGTFADGYGEKFFKLPYQPEDTLYVRETWERFECWNCDGDERGNCPKEPKKGVLDKTCGCYMYRATDEIRGDAKWHPSIHMPKEATRIWLKVTDVRVERLQEITEVQSQAEGIRGYSKDGNLYKYAVTDDWWIDFHNKHRKSFLGTWWQDMPRTAKDAFSYLWNSTIKPSDLDRYGWGANPWVWVIEFERAKEETGIEFSIRENK